MCEKGESSSKDKSFKLKICALTVNERQGKPKPPQSLRLGGKEWS
jgi:hypothetical protein